MVAVRDTVREVTTVTIATNEFGDTVKVVQITDRTRAASRDNVAAYKTKTVIKTDTVFVERRDSILVKNTNVKSRDSPFQRVLRLILWIVVGLIALGIFNFYVSSARRK